LQLVENATQVADLFVKLVPNLALCVFEIHCQFMFEPCNFFATHAASDERHYHDDIAQSERDPEDQEYLIRDEGWTASLCIILPFTKNDKISLIFILKTIKTTETIKTIKTRQNLN